MPRNGVPSACNPVCKFDQSENLTR